jgi:Bacterial sugar transferase
MVVGIAVLLEPMIRDAVRSGVAPHEGRRGRPYAAVALPQAVSVAPGECPAARGWAQVRGLRGTTSLADGPEGDNYHIENWSLGVDFKILPMTLAALFGPLRPSDVGTCRGAAGEDD